MKVHTPQILVAASSGTLANFLVDEIINSFGIESLSISDYKGERLHAYRKRLYEKYGKAPKAQLIDITSIESVKSGIEDVDYVIVPVSQKRPLIQEICIQKGVVCIDLTVSEEFIDNVIELQAKACGGESLLLMAAGLFPGLSGIIANSIHANNPEAIVDIGLLQSNDGMAGGTGIADMLQLLNRDTIFNTPTKAFKKKGFSYSKAFGFNHRLGTKQLRLAHFIEAKYLQKRLNINSNYWSAFDSEKFNQLIALLRKVRLLNLFENPKYRLRIARFISNRKPDAHEEVVGIIGQTDEVNKIVVLLESDYAATAACAVAFVKLLSRSSKEEYGVFFPFELFELNDVLKLVEHKTVSANKS